MIAPEPSYLHDNRHIAQRLLIFLEDKRLLRDRISVEDQVYCRKSADQLRGILSAEMLTVKGGGFLLRDLRDLRRACTIFVSEAGAKSVAFKDDDAFFRQHLEILRVIFAQRVGHIVQQFDLQPTTEVQQIINFTPPSRRL